MGGRWDGDWTHQVDGDKFVCLDNLMERRDGDCIVYSFGIANDWSFEDQMSTLGKAYTKL